MQISNSDNHKSVAARLFANERIQYPTQEVINHVMACIQDSLRFNDALQIVITELAKANMVLDPSVLNHLMGLPNISRSDWELKKCLCRQMPGTLLNETLIRGIFYASIQNNDHRTVIEFFTIAKKHGLTSEKVQNAYMRALIRLDQIKKAAAHLTNEIAEKRATNHICCGFFKALPTSESEVFKKLFHKAKNEKLLKPESLLHCIPFLPLETQLRELFSKKNEKDITPWFVNRVLNNHIKAGEFEKVEEIFYIAKEKGVIDDITWSIMIDFEYRIRNNVETAKNLFLESPIEVITCPGEKVPTIDLHGFSHGCAVFVVHSFLSAKKDEKELVVITGIGTSEKGNFLAMKNYIAEFIQNKFPNLRITHSENLGILTLNR